ncbi:MAG: tetratricopeptide repeat protein [Myxococcota bacterium]
MGSAACGACHAEPLLRWQGSHHDRAMQAASEATVLGDFDEARFGSFPVMTRFFRRDGGFFVNTEGPDGEYADFEVKYTFGVEPLQQYLVELPGGRLQSLTVAWDRERGRWFDLYPGERISPDDPFHWTGRYQRWNGMCASCHSTGLEKGYDPATDSYDTRWQEIDVGCEACHGPGSRHVDWARASEGSARTVGGDVGLVVDFAAGDSRFEVENCAPCHSRRQELRDAPLPGAPLLDTSMPVLLRAGLYHPDGQVDGEVYVYGSFTQSAMYREGVRCSDCHEPHALSLRREGNALCVGCHRSQPDRRFSTLIAKDYDTPEHHFHPDGSPGAACVGCHMPEKTFMEIDPRHDHSLRVPRPDLSQKLGTPNACNGCHTDRDAAWAAAATAEWYGAGRRSGPHFGETFAAARRGSPDALPGLVALAEDGSLAALVRGTALEHLAAYGPGALPVVSAATADPDPLVRAVAVAALGSAPPAVRIPVAAPLLDDPILAVRIEAARVLADVPDGELPAKRAAARERALAEFEAAQLVIADRPEAHLNLAILRARRGDAVGAEQAYRRALAIDRDFLPAYFNLASLYNREGRNADAERVFREGLDRYPDEGELHYSLGLLLAEQRRLDEAATELARAAAGLPGRARVKYNLALALQHLGRVDEAETALLAAQRLAPSDAHVTRALAILYVQRKDWASAQTYSEALVALAPGAPGPAQMLEHIKLERARAR